MSRILLRLAASATVAWILNALWEQAYQAGLDDGHPDGYEAGLIDGLASSAAPLEAAREARADGS